MSQQYEYRTEMATDILWYIDANITLEDWEFRTDLEDYLYDELWTEDDITGNGPDGYASEEECEEYLCHNLNLLFDALFEFGELEESLLDNLHKHYKEKNLARWADCTIRCYLLGEVLHNVLNDIWKSE